MGASHLLWALASLLKGSSRVSTKRARSASISSDRTAVASVKMVREPTPTLLNGTKPPASMNKTARNRRGGGRKAQAQDLVSVDGEEGPCCPGKCDVVHVTDDRPLQQLSRPHVADRPPAAPKVPHSRLASRPHTNVVSYQPTRETTQAAEGRKPAAQMAPGLLALTLTAQPPRARTTRHMHTPSRNNHSSLHGASQTTSLISKPCYRPVSPNHLRFGAPVSTPVVGSRWNATPNEA